MFIRRAPAQFVDLSAKVGGVDVDINHTDQRLLATEPALRRAYVSGAINQWKQLEQAFPTGVCDWSKPGIDQRGAIPWQTYQDAKGNVIYGGRPLGPAPRSRAVVRRRKAA